METQVKSTNALLTKETLPKQSPKTSTPVIMIEQILPSRNNPNFRGVMLRWKTERAGQATSLVSFALGGTTEEHRVAVQTFSNAVIEKFKIEEGKDINEILKEAGMELSRLTISEITESEYQALSAEDRQRYAAKSNPSTGELLMSASGEQIYRRVYFDSVNGVDKYVQSATSTSRPSNNLAI